jgi:hypothetical protein
MKAHIVLLFSLVLCGTVYAQSGINYYNTGVNLQNQAAAAEEKFIEADKKATLHITGLYMDAANNYTLAKKELSSLRYYADYNAYMCYLHSAHLYDLIDDTAHAREAINGALGIWYRLSAIDPKDIQKTKTVKEHHERYDINPPADAMNAYTNYYAGRLMAERIAFRIHHYPEMMKLAQDIIENGSNVEQQSWEANYYIAQHAADEGRICEAAKYASAAVTAADKAKPIGTTLEIRRQISEMDTLGHIILRADSTMNCVKRENLEDAAIAMSKLNNAWKDRQYTEFRIADRAYAKGRHTFDLMFTMMDHAYRLKKKELQAKWNQRINDNKKKIASLDYAQLVDFYGMAGLPDMQTQAQKDEKKAYRRENTHLLLGTDPINYLNHQYSLGVQFMLPRITQEVRFNYMNNSQKVELQDQLKLDTANLIYYHYSGYQIEYNLKFTSRNEEQKSFFYFGPEFRYTHRNFSDSVHLTEIAHPDNRRGHNLHPESDNYDATFVIGKLIRGRIFFLDLYAGVGIGYKKLTMDTFDANAYKNDDALFQDSRWNKIYIPARLGLRVGISLF